MTDAKDIAVVGAGVLGAAIAWRLAGAGHRVTMFDPTPGGVASPGSFAWLNASFAQDPVYNRLRHESLELWAALNADEPTLPVRFYGCILWEQDHFDLPAIAEAQKDLGRPHGWVDRDAMARREPAVGRPPERALALEGDGYGAPVEITRWFLDQARAKGAGLVEQEVTGISVHEGHVTGVETAEGTHAADRVILAAGIRLNALLATRGMEVPMDITPGLLATTSAAPGQITAILATPNVHVWQGGDGRFLIGADFGGGAPREPDVEAEANLDALKALLPGAEACEIESMTVRERPMPADGRPAIGPLGPAGLYVVSTHSGMTLAPLIAEMVAAEVGDGREDPRLAPYRPDREALS